MNISLLLNPMERDWSKNTETHTSRTKFNDEEWESRITKREAKSYAKAEARRVAREQKKAHIVVHTPIHSPVCMHTCSKYKCENCTKRCAHMKTIGNCTVCPGWGSRYCTHGRYRWQCKTCAPENFCIHKKRKYLCRLCPFFKENICSVCMVESVSCKGGVCPLCMDGP